VWREHVGAQGRYDPKGGSTTSILYRYSVIVRCIYDRFVAHYPARSRWDRVQAQHGKRVNKVVS
jgi:hypothetical protein